MSPPEHVDFETLMNRLEEVVARLEQEDLPLEDALRAYETGVALARQGHDRLADAERRLEELTAGGRIEALPHSRNPEDS